MSYSVGDAIAPFTIVADPEAMKAWAVFLADPNPIHLDVEAVKAKGLGDRVINQGPANVAYVINMLAAAFPGSQLESLDSRFLDNVYGGDTVIASGTITAIDGNRVDCAFQVEAEGRGTVNAGTATVLI
jgi:3-hydroxybutyryl-CoA dehydratase